MHPPITPRSRRGVRAAALAALALAASACSDRGATAPEVVDPPTPPALSSAILTCRANVRLATVECAPPSDEPATAGTARYGRVVGGQGTYVRLTSSGVAYAGGVFSFNVTVQNLLTIAMATTDGATRHADGVRVFFHAGPTVTDGEGEITVSNADGMETFTGANQPFYQYGGTLGGVDGAELGADGILATGEVSTAKSWQLAMPATVNTFSFTLLVSTETNGSSSVSAAPQVSAVSPNPMVPGATATLTGTNFSATPASNTVTIGGVAATVTAASATELTVTVPCVSSGTPAVQVTTAGMKGAAANAPLQVTERTVPVGEALVLTTSAASACNELASANGAARYLVAVFSASTSPSSNTPYVLTADGAGEAAPSLQRSAAGLPDVLTGTATAPTALGLDGHMDAARQRASDTRHLDLLEKNRRAYEQLRTEFPRGRVPRGARLNRDVVYGDPPLTRTFRVSNIAPPAGQTICSSFYVVNATRVYFDGKLAIYEDDATPDAFKSALNATMADYYDRIGDQFNADMEPVVRNNFGDILLRDAETDANGVEIALFTPRINTSFSGVAGFVVSCDQFPNNDTTTSYAPGGPYTGLNSSGGTASNGASNFGEHFYAYQPVVNAAGYTGNTPDNWYRTIRSTFIHESKHVASQSARVANNAPTYEASWLEEGTARHSEELWMRNAVDNVAWKANTGYGSLANPINLYCDVRPAGFPECLTNTRRPASIMQRHFTSLYTNMFGTNARLLSPFGATASDNASYWYATSWSLVRYAIDRYGASDAAFLTALNNSTDAGVTNLTGRAGVSIDQLLGGWALSFAADDHPLLASTPHADIQMPTWNFRSIYAGLNTDFPSTYALTYPLVPTALGFGTFAPPAITTLRGGGVLWYEISGTQSAPQLLRLQGSGGSAIPSTLRLAVTRIQ